MLTDLQSVNYSLFFFDADTFVKQQLSSLLYVKSICDLRQQQLNEGVADTDLLLAMVNVNSVICFEISSLVECMR
jgi:hypothetical protein